MNSTRPHAELQELLGAFALDAVDGEERRAVEAHLTECPRCRAEVAEHREVAALIVHGGAPAPDGIWDHIAAQLAVGRHAARPGAVPLRLVAATDPADGARRGVGAPRRAGRRRPGRATLAVAAAAVVVIIGLGVVVRHLGDRVERVEGELAAVQLHDVAGNVWVDPSARRAVLRSPDGRRRVPVAMAADGSGYLLARRTGRLPAGRTYQLWGVVGDETISLGTFPGGTDVMPFRVDPSVRALAVTEERAGGVAVSHRPALLVAEL